MSPHTILEQCMSRLTSKGQVTIPKWVRDRLGLQPGDEVAQPRRHVGEGGRAESPATAAATASGRQIQATKLPG